jgi:hypothetical protein
MYRSSNPAQSAFYQLPNGFFRVPDRRGRIGVGAGIESKTPGIYDPPLLAKGDEYDASSRAIGDVGGGEKHQLTVAEMPRHDHGVYPSGPGHRQRDGGNGAYAGDSAPGYTGGDEAHPNMPPFIAMNYYIKAQ